MSGRDFLAVAVRLAAESTEADWRTDRSWKPKGMIEVVL